MQGSLASKGTLGSLEAPAQGYLAHQEPQRPYYPTVRVGLRMALRQSYVVVRLLMREVPL